MDELDLYRIADTLSLTDAAALLVGSKPSRVTPPSEFGLPRYHIRLEMHQADANFDAALRSLSHAVSRGTLAANKIFAGNYVHVRYNGGESDGYWEPVGSLDPYATTVDVQDLRAWLAERGVNSGFFFPNSTGAPGYLDTRSNRYAPKLAAAVHAWQAVTDGNGKHPKQALLKWLREHAAEYGLTDEDGKVNETGIEEVAKVANWQPGGGAPKTPVD